MDLKEGKQTFEFDGLEADVVPSILRDFSAPIKLVPASGEVDEEELAFLAANDTDGFNRWEAGQRLYTSLMLQTLEGEQSEKTLDYVFEAFERTLTGKMDDYSIQAFALILPSEGTIAEGMAVIDPEAIHKARGSIKKTIARKFKTEIRAKYDELTAAMESEGGDLIIDAEHIGQRSLRNVMLEYLCTVKDTPEEQKEAADVAQKHFDSASGMTDKMAALSTLASMDGEGTSARDAALKKFYDDADGYNLLLDKWFSVQSLADLPDVLDRVKKLTEHPDFTFEVPNRVRSLISIFAANVAFHNADGSGYAFISEQVARLDKLNPQVSSRMANSFVNWRKYDEKRGALMKAELEKLKSMKPISDDLFEVVSRGLN